MVLTSINCEDVALSPRCLGHVTQIAGGCHRAPGRGPLVACNKIKYVFDLFVTNWHNKNMCNSNLYQQCNTLVCNSYLYIRCYNQRQNSLATKKYYHSLNFIVQYIYTDMFVKFIVRDFICSTLNFETFTSEIYQSFIVIFNTF